jgi:hypothetical protein
MRRNLLLLQELLLKLREYLMRKLLGVKSNLE